MSDHSEDPPAETPMQRALRMRKAAMTKTSKAPEEAAFNPRRTSRMSAGASKQWMKR